MFHTLHPDDSDMCLKREISSLMPSMAFEWVGGRVVMFNYDESKNEWHILSDFEGDLEYYKIYNLGGGWEKEIIATNTIWEK
jgi:hypothetical protein